MRLAGRIALLLPVTGRAITLNVPVNRFESPETAGRNEIFGDWSD